MYKFAIIGCGSLGARYIQSLATYREEAIVYAVDILDESLNKAKELFKSNKSSGKVELKLCHDIEELENNLDIVAIATTSAPRRNIIEKLLNSKNVKYLILEKVLFPYLEDYEEVYILLKQKAVKTWINCNRRIIPFFSQLKKEFENQNIRFELTGGSWGLGCNSIHYLDLINFITGSTDGISISTEKLDSEIIDSKRSGYIEFTGTLEGKTNRCEFFYLHSEAGEVSPILYSISSDNKVCIVNESGGIAYLFKRETGWTLETIPLKAYYQSTITSILFEEIMKKGSCTLPDYEIAKAEHIPFIKALLEFMNKDGVEETKRCLIT